VNPITKKEKLELLDRVYDKFLARLEELLDSKTATSTDMQLIYKALQDSGVKLDRLRQDAGATEEEVHNFVESLPFPTAGKVIG